jgi:hypothetical protein
MSGRRGTTLRPAACRTFRSYVLTLVDGFGIPEQLRYAAMFYPRELAG